MRPRNFKGRCTKKKLKKCQDVARLYDQIQIAFASLLDADKTVKSFMCNVLLEDLDIGDYTTDFVCTGNNGECFVRECVWRRKLVLPRTAKMLEVSRQYWRRRGITDWGIITEQENTENETL